MNIAIISPWAISETSVGGTERFTIDLASQLHVLGNHVEVFVLSGKSCRINEVKYTSLDLLGNEEAADEYDLQAFANNDTGDSFYAKWASYLEAKVNVSKFDAIQLNSLLFVDAWQDMPRILTIHTNPFEFRLDWGRERLLCVAKKMRRGLYKRTLLTTPSDYYSQRFSKMFQRHVLTIPHAIDISRLNHEPSTGTVFNQDADNDPSRVTILLPSRLELVQKRPQIVFRGVALLPVSLRKRITVLATGKDPQYRENSKKLERIAVKAGFEAQFCKFPSMAEAYRHADIVALPSKSESFGYSALESLALGIPTILNSLPTFKEIGAGNKKAHFFEHTAQAFSQTLTTVLKDMQRQRPDMAWSNRYDIRRWGETYQNLARSIVGNE